eukprot:1512042-Pleurochrysis_carterae.AAC.1
MNERCARGVRALCDANAVGAPLVGPLRYGGRPVGGGERAAEGDARLAWIGQNPAAGHLKRRRGPQRQREGGRVRGDACMPVLKPAAVDVLWHASARALACVRVRVCECVCACACPPAHPRCQARR